MPDRAYTTGQPELDAAIHSLVETYGAGRHQHMLSEMITTAFKLVGDGADRGEIKLVNTTLKELRHSFRVFRPYRSRRKVSIFGSARTPVGAPEYEQAVLMARRLVELGFMVITGAGGGIMQAGHEGAGPDNSFGVNIRLPFEQGANKVISGSPRLINYKYFFTRKLAFLKDCDAVICLPGGFGTHDEGFESVTLVQTGKSRMLPIVFLDAPGGDFWRGMDDYVQRHLLTSKVISPADLALYRVTDSVEAAAQEIQHFYRRYHSSRYVGELLVLRLKPRGQEGGTSTPPKEGDPGFEPPSAPGNGATHHATSATAEDVAHLVPEGLVEHLNVQFGDILKAPITASGPLPIEADEPDLAGLPRLQVPFDRRHFGRLRQLLDDLNTFP